MADNFTITQGAGTTIAAKDVGAGVLAQRVQLNNGTTDVSATNPLNVTLSPLATDGVSSFSLLGPTATAAAGPTAACTLYSIDISNQDAGVNCIKVYDKASAATQVDTPVARFALPAAGVIHVEYPRGFKFSNGISVRAVNELTDSGTTGAAANKVIVNGTYK